ncbi:hypothetical protein [Micromonospora sp. NPDC023633]
MRDDAHHERPARPRSGRGPPPTDGGTVTGGLAQLWRYPVKSRSVVEVG